VTPEFVDLVKRMRQAQSDYFKGGRSAESLNTARDLERKVDRAIKDIEAGPPKPDLFSGGRHE
jgi:hypothetical protein